MIVVRKSQIRFIADVLHTKNEAFVSKCRLLKETHFTRNRKMPLSELLLSMINRKGLTLTMELRIFFEVLNKKNNISKVGYLKQRMKLNPCAIKELYEFHTRNFYADGELRLYKKHLVLAIDGSGINIPTNPETVETYGSPSKNGTKLQAQLGLSCIYDVLNKMIIDSSINRGKFDEKKQAEEHLKKLPLTIKTRPYIVTMDRGYPSTPLFMFLIENDIKFVIRLKGSDYKAEQTAMKSNDEQIDIPFIKSRMYHYLGTEIGTKMAEMKHIQLRMVKIKLDEETTECLATNLDPAEFSIDELKNLYSMRWGIETAYEILKSKLQLENFSGTKPILLEQDIYSTIYICNLAQDIIIDVENELDEKDNSYKHQMAVNQTICIGILKNDLIYILLEKNKKKKEKLFQKMYNDISNNLVPVRPDRHYIRTKGQLAANYSNTYKRAF